LGFEQPPESDENNRHAFRKLNIVGNVTLDDGHYLEMESEGEELAQLLARRFIIQRNNSVSNRLWNVVTCDSDEGAVDARWLEQMPDEVWNVVRDSVLKCL